MFVEQPPFFYRIFFPGAFWRIKPKEKAVYLTFDDGPIPEVTPWVLEVLDWYRIKATFFCVGDNVRKHPDIYQMVLDCGHAVGNHTFNHLAGISYYTRTFLANVERAARLVKSNLFRPPRGHMRVAQAIALQKRYKIVMWDVVTRDYNHDLTPDDVFKIVRRYTRNGSIIVFHDSLKSEENLKGALARSIEWLLAQGYEFRRIEL